MNINITAADVKRRCTAWDGRRGMGLRVLVEQKMGTWHPPVTKLQTAASSPRQTPTCCCLHLSAPLKTGCNPQELGFNSSPAVPPSRAMPRGLAEWFLVHNKDTEMRKCLLWHQLAPLSCREDKMTPAPSHPGLGRVWTLLRNCSQTHMWPFVCCYPIYFLWPAKP